MQSKVVAVIDDDASMLRGIVRLLTGLGFESAAYSSAEAFLERGALNNAACLLLDIHLPGMSGIELKHRLTETDSPLPVIFMTGDDDELTRMAATEAGCVAYLRKPFPAQMLMNAIEKAAA